MDLPHATLPYASGRWSYNRFTLGYHVADPKLDNMIMSHNMLYTLS